MLDLDKNKKDWDDLDIYDRDAANIRRELRKINLHQWAQDLYTIDPDLFDNLQKYMDAVSGRRR
jgi:hypothetical protein